VKAALEKFLADARQPGAVSYLLVDDRLLGIRRYRFRVDRPGVRIPVCAVELDTRATARDEMTSRTASLVGSDYSRDFVTRYAAQNLLAIAQREGYLRARVRDVQTAREATPGGCDGVRVTVSVDEGIQYQWRAATWSGNSVFAQPDLDRLLGMTAGERADRSKIDRGIRSIVDAYRNRGFLDAAVHQALTFDDAGRQVAGTMEVVEGAQFRMGKVEIVGPDTAVVESLKALWQLAEGAAFDPSYASRFAADARIKMREALAPFKTVDVKLNRNVQAATVDVVVTFRTPSP
jgi:outer membrane protein assembly factor BamA